MKPLGRRSVRFPSKRDCHPPKGHVNWWEVENDTTKNGKKRDRRQSKKGIEKAD